VNTAETFTPEDIVAMQAPVPEHAPDHPVNEYPEGGAAESVTVGPDEYGAEQVVPQEMPAGDEVTVPPPVLVTVRV